MGQEECEQYVLDKNENYVKEVKKNPEPAFGSYHGLLRDGRDGVRCGNWRRWPRILFHRDGNVPYEF